MGLIINFNKFKNWEIIDENKFTDNGGEYAGGKCVRLLMGEYIDDLQMINPILMWLPEKVYEKIKNGEYNVKNNGRILIIFDSDYNLIEPPLWFDYPEEVYDKYIPSL